MRYGKFEPGCASLFLLATLATEALAIRAQEHQNKLPNIVLLVVDDLGFSDHSIYVDSDIPMTNFTSLAAEGITFTNYYTQTVCSPTRSSLISGRYPFRTGMQHETTILPGSTAHFPQDTPTIAELLKSKAGYNTSAVGKWHLGYAKFDYTPTGRGFDSHVGYFQGQVDYFNKTIELGYDFWGNQSVLRGAANGSYSLTSYQQEYHRFLNVHKVTGSDAPFFMYLAMQTVHVPLEAAREAGEAQCAHITDEWRHVYCSMLVELDEAIGDFVTLLKNLEYWENTVLLVTTDNGGMTDWNDVDGKPVFPASIGSNYPMRGGKTTMFEGGVHGTGFIGGGALANSVRGTKIDTLMHAVDLAATALGLAGVDLPSNLDGLDFSPCVSDKDHSQLPQRSVVPINIIHNGSSYSAIRFGDIKLIVGNGTIAERTDGYWKPGVHSRIDPPPSSGEAGYLLFNLTADPTEHIDIAEDHPDLISQGLDLISKLISSGDYMEPQLNIAHIRAYPQFHDGVWAPFEKL